ncbi:MAG TPA: outer membrane protein assembly factor BamD [Pirellulaceae bacterium]|nr:outer membrane protein assembly factor BamD [Pirellulaceae bacterium]
MSKRQHSYATHAAGLYVALALACFQSGCATTAEQEDRELRDLLDANPLSHTDPRNGSSSYSDDDAEGGFIGSDGPTLDDFSPKKIAQNWKKMTGRGPNKRLAKDLYESAEREYNAIAAMPAGEERTARFLAVGDRFAKAAEYWPGSAVEMDALFMAGEAHFFADHYWDATKFYERLVKGYPNNRYLDTVDARRFAIARYWLQLNEEHPEPFFYANFINEARPWRDARGHALRQYEKIRLDDPTGKLADDATLAVANAHFKSGRYLKADESYTDLRKSYPRSEHQFSAHYLGLKAKLESYLGPDYSGSALEEGEKLIKQMRRQFPNESEREREYLDRAAAEIRYKQAEKLFFFGRYHDKRGEYRAAGRRFQQIITDYPDTPFAEKAEERLRQIQGLPPVPPQRLPWLTKLFPTADKVKPILEQARVPEGELRSVDDEGQVLQASGEE